MTRKRRDEQSATEDREQERDTKANGCLSGCDRMRRAKKMSRRCLTKEIFSVVLCFVLCMAMLAGHAGAENEDEKSANISVQ